MCHAAHDAIAPSTSAHHAFRAIARIAGISWLARVLLKPGRDEEEGKTKTMFGKWMTTIAMMTAAFSLAACTAEASGDDVLRSENDNENGGGKVCPMLAIRCDAGYRLADTNGDGCEDACEPIACPAVMFDCAVGTGPADTNGDGCVDTCAPIVPPQE